MPNYVVNILTVKGPAKTISELKNKLLQTGRPKKKKTQSLPDLIVDFNKIIPISAEFSKCNDLDDVCRKYWGTKWNAFRQHLDEVSDTAFSVIFDTAWTPPYLVYEAIARQFPNIETEAWCQSEGSETITVFRALAGKFDYNNLPEKEFARYAVQNFSWIFDGFWHD